MKAARTEVSTACREAGFWSSTVPRSRAPQARQSRCARRLKSTSWDGEGLTEAFPDGPPSLPFAIELVHLASREHAAGHQGRRKGSLGGESGHSAVCLAVNERAAWVEPVILYSATMKRRMRSCSLSSLLLCDVLCPAVVWAV